MRTKLAGFFILCVASALAMSQEPRQCCQEPQKQPAPKEVQEPKKVPPPQKKGELLPPPPLPIALDDDLSYFENVWGMKKRFFGADLWPESERKVLANRVLTAGRFVYVLEFTRDIYNYDLENLQKILFLPDGKIRHVFFDQDNVAINGMATFGYLIHGEVSGVKGDVIRVIVEFGHDLDIMKVDPRGIQQARKMAVRRN